VGGTANNGATGTTSASGDWVCVPSWAPSAAATRAGDATPDVPADDETDKAENASDGWWFEGCGVGVCLAIDT
jgi:hypothetical protein